MSIILGIDVGATGIKGNLVDTSNGNLVGERFKLPTPDVSTPQQVTKVLKEIINYFNWKGKNVGIGFPSIISKGRILTATNIDNDWINLDGEKFFEKELKAKIKLVNDADAAGVAELYFGAAKDKKGTVILLTLGTGIGSAMFLNGKLIPNTELGHLKYKKGITENYAANSARERKKMSYKEWGKELQNVLLYIEHIFSPDLFIIGGGVSKHFNLYSKYLTATKAEIVPAKMRNDAGIIGAAMAFKLK